MLQTHTYHRRTRNLPPWSLPLTSGGSGNQGGSGGGFSAVEDGSPTYTFIGVAGGGGAASTFAATAKNAGPSCTTGFSGGGGSGFNIAGRGGDNQFTTAYYTNACVYTATAAGFSFTFTGTDGGGGGGSPFAGGSCKPNPTGTGRTFFSLKHAARSQ